MGRKTTGGYGNYAVRVGRQPGVYPTWDECEANVKGYSGAIHKRFESFNEAAEFVREGHTTYAYGIFYAIRKGHRRGVYTSWDECQKQLNGYPNSEYQCFSTRQKAEYWINQIDNSGPVGYANCSQVHFPFPKHEYTSTKLLTSSTLYSLLTDQQDSVRAEPSALLPYYKSFTHPPVNPSPESFYSSASSPLAKGKRRKIEEEEEKEAKFHAKALKWTKTTNEEEEKYNKIQKAKRKWEKFGFTRTIVKKEK